jgi:hypothetical protein
VASDQLSAQTHNSRSNSEKKTSHNIEQHLYGFDLFPKYALELLKIHKKFDGCQASVGVFPNITSNDKNEIIFDNDIFGDFIFDRLILEQCYLIMVFSFISVDPKKIAISL